MQMWNKVHDDGDEVPYKDTDSKKKSSKPSVTFSDAIPEIINSDGEQIGTSFVRNISKLKSSSANDAQEWFQNQLAAANIADEEPPKITYLPNNLPDANRTPDWKPICQSAPASNPVPIAPKAVAPVPPDTWDWRSKPIDSMNEIEYEALLHNIAKDSKISVNDRHEIIRQIAIERNNATKHYFSDGTSIPVMSSLNRSDPFTDELGIPTTIPHYDLRTRRNLPASNIPTYTLGETPVVVPGYNVDAEQAHERALQKQFDALRCEDFADLENKLLVIECVDGQEIIIEGTGPDGTILSKEEIYACVLDFCKYRYIKQVRISEIIESDSVKQSAEQYEKITLRVILNANYPDHYLDKQLALEKQARIALNPVLPALPGTPTFTEVPETHFSHCLPRLTSAGTMMTPPDSPFLPNYDLNGDPDDVNDANRYEDSVDECEYFPDTDNYL